jgi:hypothetical protein
VAASVCAMTAAVCRCTSGTGVACDERTTRSGGQLVFSAQDACLRLRCWH